jgi:hypothetical protein
MDNMKNNDEILVKLYKCLSNKMRDATNKKTMRYRASPMYPKKILPRLINNPADEGACKSMSIGLRTPNITSRGKTSPFKI